MRHAILILAHKNADFLCRLISHFSKGCDVFIHYDKKSMLSTEERQRICGYAQVVYFSQEYDVNWGGTSVLYAEMLLLRIALEKSDAQYFHLISGQDFPLCSFERFDDFFERCGGKNFVKYLHLPNIRWENNTYHRFQYYFPFDLAAGKENPRGWVREQVFEQKKNGIKRSIPDDFDHLYGASQWFSINREAVRTLLDYTRRHPSLYKRMWMTFSPEESYVATVLVNLLGTEKVVPCNHRFIRWKNENGNCPANLSKVHFYYLLENECFFARKLEKECSENLLCLINKYLLHDAAMHQGKNGGWIYDGYQKYVFENSFCSFVERFCFDVCVKSAVDLGCGAGYYVARWRRSNLPFAGYDANPYTPMLSKFILENGDEECGIADITDELSYTEPFHLVVCKDVLPYIPRARQQKAIENIARLSSHFVIVSWQAITEYLQIESYEIEEGELIQSFLQYGFIVENYMTARLRISVGRKDCCVLIKQGKPLIG